MSTPGGEKPLPLALARIVDAACQRFEALWKAAGSGVTRPCLEDHVAAAPEEARAALFWELLAIEGHHRRCAGETPGIADYRERFPTADPDRLAAALQGDVGAADAPSWEGPTPHRSPQPSVSPGTRLFPPAREPMTPLLPESGGPAALPRVPGFEVLREIGRGGMGVVYLARQPRLNRLVALKMVLHGAAAGPQEANRFRREAEAAARLRHPNIVQIHEIGEHAGRPYLALEYVEGGNLAGLLRRQPLLPAEAARLTETLARALHHAHERGIVHRDLKPANILLQIADCRLQIADLPEVSEQSAICNLQSAIPEQSAIPKLTDFGLAKELDEDVTQTRTGIVAGTPPYMAPEQTFPRSSSVGPATDVYGLGAVLYEMLTGRPPFQGESPIETLLEVRTREPVSPSQLRPQCPRDLVIICLKCLRKEPEKRYASALDLAEDLARFREGRPIAARPVGWAEACGKWIRRRPGVATLLAILAVAVGLGLVGVLWQWREAVRGRTEAEDARVREAAARADADARGYTSLIAQADLELAASRLLEVERLLGEWKRRTPERCHWEWDYLKRQCGLPALQLAGHTQPIVDVRYSPDGRLLASCASHFNATEPGGVKLWDLETGLLLRDLRGPQRAVYKVAFHPGGDWLAAGSLDGHIYRWDLQDPGRQIPPLKQTTPVSAVAVHPRGTTLAAGGYAGIVTVWDVATGKSLGGVQDHHDIIFDLAYSPDGKLLASGSRDGMIRLRDPSTGRPVGPPLHHGSDVRRLGFSPNSRLLASASFQGTLKVWDLAGAPRPVVTHQLGPVVPYGATFSPDGERLVCPTSNGIRIWAVQGQRELPSPGTGAGPSKAAAVSPDGRWLAAPKEDHLVRVWDMYGATDPRLMRDVHRDWVVTLEFAPGGTAVALAGGANWAFARLGDHTVRIIDWPGGRFQKDLRDADSKGPFTNMAYHPTGARLVAGRRDGTAVVWDVARAEVAFRCKAHPGAVESVAYHPGGEILATAGADGGARLWDATTGEPRGELPHPGGTLAVAFSSDGTLVATGGADREVHVWDVSTRERRVTLRGHPTAIRALAFRPGTHELVSADVKHGLRFWEADTGEERTAGSAAPETAAGGGDRDALPATERSGIRLAFSGDGRRLLVVPYSLPAQLWDVATRRRLLTLAVPGETENNLCGAFGPGDREVVIGANGSLRVWDARPRDFTGRPQPGRATPVTWHEERSRVVRGFRDWFALEFHATRMTSDAAQAQRGYSLRALARAAQGRAEDAAEDHRRALAAGPDNAALWSLWGEALVHQKQWPQADLALETAVRRADTAVNWYNRVMCRLAAGDEAGYHATGEAMVGRFRGTTRASEASAVVYALAPLKEGGHPGTLLTLGKLAATYFRGNERALGAAHYRAGQYREALVQFSVAQPVRPPAAWDHLFVAMAHHRLGHADGREWLEQARAWVAEAERIENSPTDWSATRWADWRERAEVLSLLREAEALLGAGEKR